MELLRGSQRGIENRHLRGVRGLAIRSLMALAALTATASAAHTQESTPSLTIEVACAGSHSPYGQPEFLLPPHIEVFIKGENIGSPDNREKLVVVGQMGGYNVLAPERVVWTRLLEASTGRTFTLAWNSTEDPNVAVTLDGYLSTIRPEQRYSSQISQIEGDPNFIRSFTSYEVSVGIGRYTEGTPVIEREIVRDAFSADCTNVPTWALPTWMR